MSKEIWKDVIGYEGLYQVSNMGRIKSFHHSATGQILKPQDNGHGYLQITLYGHGRPKQACMHRLVLRAFYGLPPSPDHQGNHKNGIRSDNRLDNLEWMTKSENEKHACRVLGKAPPLVAGETNGQSKLTDEDVIEIRRLYATGEHTQRELGDRFGVDRATIGLIVRRETWKHVP